MYIWPKKCIQKVEFWKRSSRYRNIEFMYSLLSTLCLLSLSLYLSLSYSLSHTHTQTHTYTNRKTFPQWPNHRSTNLRAGNSRKNMFLNIYIFKYLYLCNKQHSWNMPKNFQSLFSSLFFIYFFFILVSASDLYLGLSSQKILLFQTWGRREIRKTGGDR